MVTQSPTKANQIKHFAGLFFIGLATLNLILTVMNVGVRLFDLLILILVVVPFIMNKRKIFLLFGFLSGLTSLYMTVGCLIFSLNPDIQTSAMEFFMGFVLSIMSLTFSIGLIYVGIQGSENSRLNLS